MLRTEGPLSSEVINAKHIKVTSGKPGPSFISNMVKRGWIARNQMGQYYLTKPGTELLLKNNTFDETMAQPRSMSMFDRGIYRGEGLSYRGKR